MPELTRDQFLRTLAQQQGLPPERLGVTAAGGAPTSTPSLQRSSPPIPPGIVPLTPKFGSPLKGMPLPRGVASRGQVRYYQPGVNAYGGRIVFAGPPPASPGFDNGAGSGERAEDKPDKKVVQDFDGGVTVTTQGGAAPTRNPNSGEISFTPGSVTTSILCSKPKWLFFRKRVISAKYCADAHVYSGGKNEDDDEPEELEGKYIAFNQGFEIGRAEKWVDDDASVMKIHLPSYDPTEWQDKGYKQVSVMTWLAWWWCCKPKWRGPYYMFQHLLFLFDCKTGLYIEGNSSTSKTEEWTNKSEEMEREIPSIKSMLDDAWAKSTWKTPGAWCGE